jgi:hypothetical protein
MVYFAAAAALVAVVLDELGAVDEVVVVLALLLQAEANSPSPARLAIMNARR